MKVVLVMPPHDVWRKYGLASNRLRVPIYPPLGVGYLAAGLRQRGHTARFLDGPALGWTTEAVAEAVVREKPDAVGIACFSIGRRNAYEMAARVKTLLPRIPVIMGGPHVTSAPESVIEECPQVDILLRGEADLTLGELVDWLEAGRSYDDIPGIYFRCPNGTTVSVPIRWEPDLDRYPFPARDIYDARLYYPVPMCVTCPPTPLAVVIASRGCSWGQCRFCSHSGRHAPRYRQRSVENVIEELRGLVTHDRVRFVFFLDDNFTNKHAWVNAFCDRLDQEHWGLKWMGHARVDTVSPELLRRMAKSGCINLSYGFESGNQETLDLMRKGTTLDQARQAARWTHEAGIEIHGNWMMAFPGETPAMTENTFHFAAELNTAYFQVLPYYILPLTPLADLARREGRVIEQDRPTYFTPSYVPNTYESAEQVEKKVRSFVRRYYLRPRYLLSALWRARNPRIFLNYARKASVLLHGFGG